MIFSEELKKQIGLLLMIERHKRGLQHKYITKKTNISPEMLDWTELGAQKNNWQHYGELLNFYQKDLVIALVDRHQKEKHHEI